MKKFALGLAFLILLGGALDARQIESLSHIFLLGKGILDTDGDGFADTPALTVLLPDSPNPHEIAAAGDLSARLNLESLRVEFSCVQTESQWVESEPSQALILIGSRLRRARRHQSAAGFIPDSLKPDQGLVSVFTDPDGSGVILIGGSDRALLRTGRAFFLRWPYFWEIWGRQEGETYFTLESDLRSFLESEGIQDVRIDILRALYSFPPRDSAFEAVKRLEYDTGQIQTLTVRVRLADSIAWQQARDLLHALEKDHRRGKRTDILSYSGCARISFELEGNGRAATVNLDRMGYPKRLLTPGYRSPRRPRIPEKNFDLLDFLSARAAYADIDRDGLPDRISTSVILSPGTAIPEPAQLAARLALPTAGGSFPLMYLDSEIEDPKLLDSPVLIGRDNVLVQELIRTGKLHVPELSPRQALIQVVPSAFNKSNALVFLGADPAGQSAALGYFSRTFPYLERYQTGAPGIQDMPEFIDDLLQGKKGSAEAYFHAELNKILDQLEEKTLESVGLELVLPEINPPFEAGLKRLLEETLEADEAEIRTHTLQDAKVVFTKARELDWEGEEALRLIREHLADLKDGSGPVSISLGLSESPDVRARLMSRITALLRDISLESASVEVLSSYKQGFFWIMERILPRLMQCDGLHRLLIRFSRAEDDLTQPKRFYQDPYRWLQELYPVDELIAGRTSLSLEDIVFEIKDQPSPVYEVIAFDAQDTILLQEGFSPRTRRIPYLSVLPEWGDVTVTTGWLTIHSGREPVADVDIRSDLERFWAFYQEDVLPEVHDHILQKTNRRPSFDKQPYFKRLLIELWLSEPDYRLGLDEEIVSSLEAVHDELYFDTLDFLRGITEIDPEDGEELPEDSSRYSAPGNILPMIHPSLEGKSGRVKITLEDWQARTPQMEIRWQEPARHPESRKVAFPEFKSQAVRIPALVYAGDQNRIDRILASIELEAEKEYLTLIDILDAMEGLQAREMIPDLELPQVNALHIRVRHQDLSRETRLRVEAPSDRLGSAGEDSPLPERIVPTQEIISHEMCRDLVRRLSTLPAIRSYRGGHSFEGRSIDVLEIFTPRGSHVSLPRLITAKPTLYMSGRQHANEVSATNYILRWAELLARDPHFGRYPERMNFVLHPLENPDGAALAYELQKLTPFHSLHAGRYSSLGIDTGYQVGSARPLLPEAKVRGSLNQRWLPDIYLNLHGYPSHEWVQPFSGYVPYLFRDYWIPRGWFAFFRAVSLPLYPDWVEAGRILQSAIVRGMQGQPDIHDSNRRFYDRYERWAARWHPHMNYLERYDGVNLYAKRRSSRESRLTERRRITYVEQTTELMDETARGEWLEFLVRQGISYLRAHADYLWDTAFIRERIEEESDDRIHISFVRKRPGEGKE